MKQAAGSGHDGVPVCTTCPYCGVGCGLAVNRSTGGFSVQGDVEHPANRGRLCIKGASLTETLGDEERLLYPTIDRRRVDWCVALDHVASSIRNTIIEHGPDSVAFYVSGQLLSEDYYVANKLLKGYLGTANIDTNSRLCMASSVAGHRRAFGSDTVPGSYEDFELADLVVLCGSNLAWCHPVLFQRLIAARERRPGMRIVVIDPRRTATAEIADLHLPVATDADAVLYGGLLNWLERHDGLADEYLEQHVSNVTETLRSVAWLDSDRVAELSGLSKSAVECFYTWFTERARSLTVFSQGINQSSIGTDTVNAILNVHLATGRIGTPGAGPFSITGQPNAMGGREVGGLANTLACHMELENPQHRRIVQQFWRSPVMADRAGLKAVDLFRAMKAGRIKLVWIMATNPLVSLPHAERAREALARCPEVIVSDVSSASETVAFANTVLPAAAWGEKEGTVTNSDRCISRQRAFRSPPGEARPDWWMICEVARRLGYAGDFAYAGPAAIFREHAALSGVQNHGDRDFDISACASLSDREYAELKPFYWPNPVRIDSRNQTPDTRPLRFFAAGGFYTPDRRARMLPLRQSTLLHCRSRIPLVLNTGRLRDHWHTLTRTGQSETLSAHTAEPGLEIHPDDARARGIGDAELVDVFSPHGRSRLRALITRRQRRGSVFAPMHWTSAYASSARINSLVAAITDPVSGQPALKGQPVEVQRFSARCYGFAVLRSFDLVPELDYWAKARCPGGWRLEFASRLDSEALCMQWRQCLYNTFAGVNITADEGVLLYRDAHASLRRVAVFDGARLWGMVFLGPGPVTVSRSWATQQLKRSHDSTLGRVQVLAGCAAADSPDPGQMVCSCRAVGRNTILTAVRERHCRDLATIGQCTGAGTECGSCRSELLALLRETENPAETCQDAA